MGGVFVSYRRDDAGGHAGRLFDRLAAHYGRAQVFMDHDDLAPGVDFAHALDEALRAADVVLAVIGPRWLDARDAAGRRRLDDPADFVRFELERALAAGHPALVQVLVGGASLPAAQALPAPLAALAGRQAVVLRDARFDDDVAALIAGLARAGLAAPAVPAASVIALLVGRWAGEVTYPWGVTVTEHFDFARDGDELYGTGTWLGGRHPLEEVAVDEAGLRFVLHSEQIAGDERRSLTHRFRMRPDGDGGLEVRVQSFGGYSHSAPVRYRCRRA